MLEKTEICLWIYLETFHILIWYTALIYSLLWYWMVLLKRLICIFYLILQFFTVLWISLKFNDVTRKWKNIYLWISVWRKYWPTIIMLSDALYASLIWSHLYISTDIFLSFSSGNISWSNLFNCVSSVGNKSIYWGLSATIPTGRPVITALTLFAGIG